MLSTSTVFAMLMINALGAMGSPCVRPSKDIRARIESALDEIDEINQCHGEHVLMLCTVAVFNSKLLFLSELCLRKWISEIRALHCKSKSMCWRMQCRPDFSKLKPNQARRQAC